MHHELLEGGVALAIGANRGMGEAIANQVKAFL